ncbi:tRNA (cytidine(34)-2'-O)-methyltransferase, partial [Ralstonia pseudosolanacearum]|uniref:tRNA (cytidine(34)-2'-O)-methyltransferase n=1 Tax=Ralstonia pseudosolanacearum TaxID=1310165 RepID=UPI003D186382
MQQNAATVYRLSRRQPADVPWNGPLRMRVALFQPDIPHNVGAAIRLAACLAVPLDVIEPGAFPLSDKSVRRAAMDYAASAEVSRHDSWAAFLAAPARAEGRLLLFSTRAAEPFQHFAYAPG